MAEARRRTDDDSVTRSALLDAAERIMLEDGYAAVTSRRVAERAGLNATSAVVYYYFGAMDNLFVAVFRRRAEESLRRYQALFGAPQPLWALWDLSRQKSATAFTLEFLALGNHRKAIRSEIARTMHRLRKVQFDALTEVLESYGVDMVTCPPAFALLLVDWMSRFFEIEEAYGVRAGHDEVVRVIERHILELEGERLP